MARQTQREKLTPREREVLALLRVGLTDAAIGERLGISTGGASYHVSQIIGKLGVRDRYEAAAWPEAAPWWAKAVLPLAALWRRAATSGTAGIVSAGAVIVVVVAGLGLMLALMLRADGEATGPRFAAASRSATPTVTLTPRPSGGTPSATQLSVPVAEPSATSPNRFIDIAPPITVPPPLPASTANDAVQIIDGCIVPDSAVEIFPPEAAARGQRVWEGPGFRVYLRADGTCVNLLGPPPLPDYAPDELGGATPIPD